MSRFMTDINARQLLEAWRRSGMLSPDNQGRLEQFIQSQHRGKELPLYLRALVGLGAFIAALCFIIALGVSGVIDFDSKAGPIVWGLVFVAVAKFLLKSAGQQDGTVRHDFLVQTSFCAMAMGKGLFVAGFAQMFATNSTWAITAALLFITAALYRFYDLSIDRFLSSLAVLCSILFNIVLTNYSGLVASLLLNLFFLGQLVLAAVLFTDARANRIFVPLAYAAAFSLCITVVYLAAESTIGLSGNGQPHGSLLMTVSLTAALAGLIAWAAGGVDKLKSEPLLVALFGAVLLGVIAAPGVILSVYLMVLGYARHERLLLFMGIALCPVVIFFYYYNLDISLMAKSGVLVGSGLVLLAGYGYLAFRKLDREAA
ncbi:MAG: DUF4401 domain-containing protein [Proteobacteria bacterium]|nr:DUF4401 domain-containing protein [Pseudomonadota bacterium]